MPIIVILCLILTLTVPAQAGEWTPYKTLRDTAADAIDFTWKKECPPSAASECRLVWKFLNRYQKPVRLTWRVVYRTNQGTKELLNETTVPPGESPEFETVGETLETAQVGVPRNEVRSVGVTPLTAQPPASRFDTADLVMADGDVDYAARLQKYARRSEERKQRLATSFAETKDLMEKCEELYGPLLKEAQRNATQQTKPKRKKKP